MTEPFDPEPILANLPPQPGVYRMVDADDAVLYVGKARNLRSRVTSYFRAAGLTTKTMALVAKTRDIRVTATQSETEALLLEQSLIKEENPPYNIVLRDDKSYPFILLTEHPYPRLAFHRGAKNKPGRYFGPFPSASAVRDSLNILQKLFGIRPCEDGFFKNRSRPCLQYQIERCSGPCVGLVDRQRYADDVRLAVMFLEGKSQDILDEFKAKMEQASNDLEFERAARYRDQVDHLRRVQENQYVHGASGNVDVFGTAMRSGHACVVGLFVRDGRMLGHRTWHPKDALGVREDELLFAFLSQYYLGEAGREIPKTVVTSLQMREADLLAETLAERAGFGVEVTSSVRGARARWVMIAMDNASLSLNTLLADRKNMLARFVELQQAFGWDEVPARLECFDISHSSGEATVASCVVFDTNGPLKSSYRRFNIEGVPRGDDYAAMEQALRRRYTSLKKKEEEQGVGMRGEEGIRMLPDAIVVDGGKGQLARAVEIFDELQIYDVTLIGIAKGPARKAGLETILEAGKGRVPLDPNGPAMHLLQHIRDEAHRFAIAGHRGQRGKRRRRSELDGIAGVGPKRKRELLAHFGSVATVKGASIEEIAKVPGINRKLAEEIYGVFHNG